jgi:hypothetical protein
MLTVIPQIAMLRGKVAAEEEEEVARLGKTAVNPDVSACG